jgi:molecular chaperone GrpE (heat shock protein)
MSDLTETQETEPRHGTGSSAGDVPGAVEPMDAGRVRAADAAGENTGGESDTGTDAALAAIAALDVRLAELTDLFRRRLLEDRNNKATLDVLHGRLKSAHSTTELQFLMPLIRRLFNVIDRLGSVPGEFADSAVQELTDILAMYEVTVIVPVSPAFDPATQEAVSVVATDRPDQDGRVAAVRRRGWRHGERVLRPTLVDVSKLIE